MQVMANLFNGRQVPVLLYIVYAIVADVPTI